MLSGISITGEVATFLNDVIEGVDHVDSAGGRSFASGVGGVALVRSFHVFGQRGDL